MKSQFAIYVVGVAVVLSCSATKVSASPGTEEKAPLSERENVEPEAFDGNQWGYGSRIGSQKSGCQTAREAAEVLGLKGIEILFSTMKHELVTVPPGNENLSGNTPEDDSSYIETIRKEIFSAWRELLYTIFSQIPRKHPLACAKNQKAVLSVLEDGVNFMVMGLAASSSRRYISTLIELEGLRNATDCRLTKLALDIQAIIRGCRRYCPQTIAALDRAQNETIFNALSCNKNIFGGIQVILDTISCEADTGYEDSVSLITDFHKKATVGSKGWVHTIFDTVELLFPVYPKK